MATVALGSSDKLIDNAYVFKLDESSWKTVNIAYVYTLTYGWKVVFPGPPGVPPGVTATPTYDATNGSRIFLSWIEPYWDGGGPSGITNYEIWESTDGTNFSFKAFQGNNTTSRYISVGINACTTYYYKVAAINAAGRGVFSPPTAAVTAYETPGAPTNVTAVAGNGTITLSWSPPAYNGCNAIDFYQVQRNQDGNTNQTNWVSANNSAGTNTHVFSGLTNGTTYYVRVRALNDTYTNDNVNNDGTPSAFVSATPTQPASVPSTPSVTGTVTNTNWIYISGSSSSNGGAPILDWAVYEYRYLNYGGTFTLEFEGFADISPIDNSDGNNTYIAYTTFNALPARAYFYAVAARNSAGYSDYGISNQINIQSYPTVPTNLTASQSSGAVTLNWTAPSFGGYNGIAGYKIQRNQSPTPGTAWITRPGATPTNFTTGTLTSGNTYYFRVRAYTAEGAENVNEYAQTSITIL